MKKTCKDETNILKDVIYQEWRARFSNYGADTSLFLAVYERRYQKFMDDAAYHRDMNFRLKGWYKIILIASVIVQITLIVTEIVWLSYKLNAAILFSKLIITLLIQVIAVTVAALLIIVKRVDVHKYQETWARTRQTLHNCRSEMVRYVEGLSPYNNESKRKVFIERIMSVLDMNRAKFTKNLEDKEKGLFDELSLLKK